MTSGVGPIDGLISGMNTSQVIAQLMQLAAQPQANLKKQVSQENLVISAYQTVNTKMSTLMTAAQAFTPPNSLTPVNPTWQAVKATSSDTSVTATATTGATAGSFTFDVTSLAKAQVTTASVSSSGPVTTGSGLDVTAAGKTTHLDITDDTADGVAKAINAAKLGVTASVVTTTSGTVLQFSGNSTGAANSFSIAGLASATTNITAASDATIVVGSGTAGAYAISSPTNTFGNVLPNVTLTVSKLTTGATVDVTSDQDAVADKMQALVDAANAALAQINQYTSYNASTKTGGPLTGDFTVRQLQGKILSAVSNGLSGYGSYKQFGVELTKDGTLTFDRDKFLVAYNADPSAVQNAVSTGLAKTMNSIADGATHYGTGTLTTAIQSGQNQITELNKRISDWDTRLAVQQKALQTQFANMETALGTLKNQSTWLAGQIAGLPTAGG
ncbi:flagellar filament capping protein FliD [Planosporangium thailandense]|uniref:Flagellar hook-associated protein 2 n=1 Tax=Planosporangium thailandense TaxID=765197 RepID=A0ABX0Y0F6_9ACTN|nr:flagellar filament capping protein FliD [Planosporangium thailandense]NJC71803.1 flagellar filament capping protein FliD [Planosporangium thailandense]